MHIGKFLARVEDCQTVFRNRTGQSLVQAHGIFEKHTHIHSAAHLEDPFRSGMQKSAFPLFFEVLVWRYCAGFTRGSLSEGFSSVLQ